MEKLFKGFCIFMSVIILLSSVTMVYAINKSGTGPAVDLFSCNDIVENIKNLEMNMTSIIYVQNSEGAWEEYQRIHGEENRIWVSIDKVPQTLIDAFVAIEDQRFFTHNGVDWKRTASAFINYLPFIDLYDSNQGGSTITQQLIKNITSDKGKNATRKLREIARALIIERMLDKEVILEAYLNTISLGNGICGVQVAANYYFNKDVSELSLAECASIAAITKNPSAYNPDKNPEDNKVRRKTVLDKMLELKKITQEEYDSAYNLDVLIDKSQQSNFEIPINSYFVDTLIDNIINDLSEKYACSLDTASSMLYNGGYKIYATVDSEIQSTMEEYYLNYKKNFPQTSKKDKTEHLESAMTIMDYEGHILGIVGGTGKKTVNRGLNRAIDSPRQPGSAMKPLGVYVQAIEQGITTYSSRHVDKPLESYYPNGKKGPKEWYGYYAGTMTLQKALERSANTIPCWLLQDIGVENSYKFLTEKLRFKHLTEVDKNLSSLALGGCEYGVTTTEATAAYAIFGNGGKYYKPVTYYKVERATGEIVLQCDTEGDQVVKPATASIMNKLLQNVVYGSQGTGKRIAGYSKMKAFAKTGTSSEAYNSWLVAGTPYYVSAVWCGFDKQEKITATSAAANAWKNIMSQIHKGLEVKEFEMTDDVITAKYCRSTGKLATDKCYSTADGYYVPEVDVEVCNGKHSSSAGASDTSSSSDAASSGTSSAVSDASSGTSSEGDNSSVPTESNDSSEESTKPPSSSSSEGNTSSEPTNPPPS